MSAQIAIAPRTARPIAPSSNASSSRASNGAQIAPQTQRAHARPLRPLLASGSKDKARPQPVALAPAVDTHAGKARAPVIAPSPTTSIFRAQPALEYKGGAAPTAPMMIREGSSSASLDSMSSSNESSSSRQVSESPVDADGQGQPTVQPKGDWVLPARAKPGRKPSETEPPTKRKAQNRASQRAFRERKQSYVATLEEKIDEFDRRGVEVSIELQKVARRLKEENTVLQRENQKLVARLQGLEKDASLCRCKEGREATENSTVHQVSNLNVQDTAGSRKKKVALRTDEPDDAAPSSVRLWNTAAAAARDGSPSIASMNRDCGFCTDQSPCLCNGEAILDLTSDDELNTTVTPTTDMKQEKGGEKDGSLVSSTVATAPSKATGRLWYTVSSMGPPPTPPVQICPTSNERRARFPFRLGSSSNILPPLQITSRGQPKLWPVYSPLQQTFSKDHSRMSSQEKDAVPIYRLKRTGATGDNSTAANAVCSGDPSQCNACSTDPALAAFCRAVASHLSPHRDGQAATPAIFDAGNAIPLRHNRKRSHSKSFVDESLLLKSSSQSSAAASVPRRALPGIDLYTNERLGSGVVQKASSFSYSPAAASTSELQSIPEAWKRIKQHPSFPKWQGGLDMLADVVSKRSEEGGELSPSSTMPSPVDIERRPSVAMKLHRKSYDRSSVVGESTSREPYQGAMPAGTSTSRTTDDATCSEDREGKRRRLYVERQSVEEALALLDRGCKTTAQQTKESSSSCVCPLNRSI
ncbi:hypothetical protein CBS101457_000310 [Exobasidium rhododendri]|nr:hypothetical protein CBS101457_000310 [Exobasidium rhododendri]